MDGYQFLPVLLRLALLLPWHQIRFSFFFLNQFEPAKRRQRTACASARKTFFFSRCFAAQFGLRKRQKNLWDQVPSCPLIQDIFSFNLSDTCEEKIGSRYELVLGSGHYWGLRRQVASKGVTFYFGLT